MPVQSGPVDSTALSGSVLSSPSSSSSSSSTGSSSSSSQIPITEQSRAGTQTDTTLITSASPFIDPASTLTDELSRPTHSLLEPARRSIQTHSLLKTPEQRRNDEIRTTLIALPDFVVKTIIDYVPEDRSLKPFILNEFGDAARLEISKPLIVSIIVNFSSPHSDAALIRKEIIRYHTRALLDPIHVRMFLPENSYGPLNAIRAGNQKMLKDRKQILLAAARYLPAATYEKLIGDELTKIAKLETTPSKSEAQEQQLGRQRLNLQLFMDILRSESDTNGHSMAKSVDEYQLDLMLIDIKSDIAKKNYGGAHQKLLEAFDFACKSGNKRRVIDIGFQLIDLARTRYTNDFMDVFNFALQIRELCQSYPADYDLYLELVFKMDNFARERSRLDLAEHLYRDATVELKISTMPCIPARYNAKMLYRFTSLRHISTPQPLGKLRLLLNAISEFHKIHKKNHYCVRRGERILSREPKGHKITDVSLAEFLRQFSALYRLAASLANDQINQFSTMSAKQRVAFSALSTLCQSMDQDLNYDLVTTDRQLNSVHHVLEGHKRVTMSADFTRDQLLLLTVDCLKNALKIMLDTSREEINFSALNPKPDISGVTTVPVNTRPFGRDPNHWRTFTIAFDDLVTLYLKHGMLAELSQLLNKKHTDAYKSFPDFSINLRGWRKSLEELQPKSEQSKSPENPAKRQKVHDIWRVSESRFRPAAPHSIRRCTDRTQHL